MFNYDLFGLKLFLASLMTYIGNGTIYKNYEAHEFSIETLGEGRASKTLLKALFTDMYFGAGRLVVSMNSSYLNVNLKDQVYEKGSTNDSRPLIGKARPNRPLPFVVVRMSVLGTLVILQFCTIEYFC